MAPTPIGEILVNNGVLTPEQLKSCLDLQDKEAGKLGQVLIREGYTTAEEVFHALSEQLDAMLVHSIEELGIEPGEDMLLSRTSMLQKLERLSKLSKTTLAISGKDDFDGLLAVIANEARLLLDAERSTLFLLSESGEELWAKVALGVEETETLRIDAKTGVAGHVVSTGEVVCVEDAYADERFSPVVDERTGYRTKTICCVPLRGKEGRIIGAFQVLNKLLGTFTLEDAELLEGLANQAALIIERTIQLHAMVDNNTMLAQENLRLRQEISDHFPFTAIVGRSNAMTQVIRLVEKAIDSSINVLVTGESGTGKELIAKTIHYNSDRSEKPFLPLNCAALPESLLEAELFGIEKGVATGVDKRPGKFEQADGGTIFLDEIGDMAVGLQAKLLRVFEDGEIYRLGASKPMKVDVRVLAATNQNLPESIEQGSFREDLFWRLNAFPIHLPALREHPEVIPELAEHFFTTFPLTRKKELKGIAPEIIERFTAYAWPGNVRELKNEIERAVTLADPSSLLTPSLLSKHVRTADARAVGETASAPGTLKDVVRQVEVEAIRQALAETDGNKQKAAKRLGISREGLRKKMLGYGMS
ncbi:sigma 54-interacting transcriptional regulator [Nitrospinae bacterium AH_259_B05_G02_I21]|nr:sigma 54-interacting transcriptional regulator [Nitrospinae bacterium AH_259_B05_G02_I21]